MSDDYARPGSNDTAVPAFSWNHMSQEEEELRNRIPSGDEQEEGDEDFLSMTTYSISPESVVFPGTTGGVGNSMASSADKNASPERTSFHPPPAGDGPPISDVPTKADDHATANAPQPAPSTTTTGHDVPAATYGSESPKSAPAYSIGPVVPPISPFVPCPPMHHRPVMLEEDSSDDSFERPSQEIPPNDTRLEDELHALEDKVVLGSDDMLHHRRLPSTIYEDSSNRIGGDDVDDDAEFLLMSPAKRPSEEKGEGKGCGDDQPPKPRRPPAPPQSSLPLQRPLGEAKKSISFDNLRTMFSVHDDLSRQQQQLQHPEVVTLSSSFQRLKDERDKQKKRSSDFFAPVFSSTCFYQKASRFVLKRHYSPVAAATWVGFWALLHVTCSNYVLTPLRDAIALQVGVEHMPTLTLVSTVLAFGSSVPIGWLFEAPDPSRRRLWKRMGLTRGETQGTSLALFYRFFAMTLVSYAIGFYLIEGQEDSGTDGEDVDGTNSTIPSILPFTHPLLEWCWDRFGKTIYIAFFLVVHLMKLHSTSLIWGVTTEAMEYEEVARQKSMAMESNKTRLQRLALVGFGGTLGGILGRYVQQTQTTSRLIALPRSTVLKIFFFFFCFL